MHSQHVLNIVAEKRLGEGERGPDPRPAGHGRVRRAGAGRRGRDSVPSVWSRQPSRWRHQYR